MRLNGTTRAILRRPLSRQQWRILEAVPHRLRPGALWRTLKFNHPWPRHRARRNANPITEA